MKKYFLFFMLLTALATLVSSSKKKVKIWMIGDSTMAIKKKDRYPETGWGVGLQQLVTKNAVVCNHAVNGRSTKSFIDEGRWNKVMDSIRAGDYVVMQFGHNDEKPKPELHTDPFTTYKANIKKFIDETRSKGAHPIVCSSIVRRHFDELGNLKDTHGDYIVAAKEIAAETQIDYVDMEVLTRKLVAGLGAEKAKSLFLFCEPGECPNYADGVQDSTHLNAYGALEVAKLFVGEIKAQKSDLSKWVK